MSCSSCTEAKPIPSCAESLHIGTVEVTDPVYISVKNNANGFEYQQEVVPDEFGNITLDLTLPYVNFYSPNFYYTLSVSETEDGNTPVVVTNNEVEYDCFTIKFKKVYNDDDLINSLTDVNLTI